MTNDDKHKFCEAWSESWMMAGKVAPPEVLNLAYNLLKQYPLADTLGAMAKHMKSDNGMYAVTPAHVICYLQSSSDDLAHSAWALVEKSLSQIGAYRSVIFDDKIIMKIISEAGGWIKLCHTDYVSLAFVQKDFIARYQSLYGQQHIESPKMLNGLDSERKPTRIGSSSKGMINANGK